MIAAYQSDPSNPGHTAAIVIALDVMIRYLARTRAPVLGRADAKQEAIAEVLSACQGYDLTQLEGVERSLMGAICNALRPTTRRAARNARVEVPLDEASEAVTHPPSMRRTDLELAIKAGKINDEELQLLSWRHLDGRAWEDIGAELKTTPEGARKTAERIAQRLLQWASEKKKK